MNEWLLVRHAGSRADGRRTASRCVCSAAFGCWGAGIWGVPLPWRAVL